MPQRSYAAACLTGSIVFSEAYIGCLNPQYNVEGLSRISWRWEEIEKFVD